MKKKAKKIEETKIIHIFAAEYYELACYHRPWQGTRPDINTH
jgi:hypothetical protein